MEIDPNIAHAAAQRAAFAELVRMNETSLLRLARRLYRGDDDRAQDLVQDALVRAYQAYLAGRFDPEQNARAWFSRIVTNLFINDHLRRRRWEAGMDFDTLTSSGQAGPPETQAVSGDVPGVRLLAQTLDEELEQALNTLPETMRDCVILIDVQGLEYAEAAAALKIPIGTVRSRLARSRMQLHDKLQDFARKRGLTPSAA